MRSVAKRPRGLGRWAVALVVGATCVAGGHGAARAQSDDERAGARASAMEGVRAFQEKRWAEAVDYFSKAESLVHAPPHLLYLARAYTNLGQLVKARETYLKLSREKIDANAPLAFQNAQTEATKELPAIEARIPSVKVLVEGAPAGKKVAVTQDGAAFAAALIGVSRPVDPGKHKYQASTDGFASDVTTVTIAESAHQTVTLVMKPGAAPAIVPPAPDDKPPAPADAKPAAAAGAPPGSDTPPPPSSKARNIKLAAYISLGAGAVGLGLGTVFAVASHNNRVKGDDLCPGGKCPESSRGDLDSLNASAKTDGQLSLVSFLIGGAGVVTGVTLLMAGPKSPAPAKAASIQPWIGLGSAGVSGSF